MLLTVEWSGTWGFYCNALVFLNSVMIRIQKLFLHVPQLIGQIHIDLMGIYKALGLLPESVKFLLAVCLYVHYLWRTVDTLAVLEYGNQQFAHGVGSGSQQGLLPGLDGPGW